MCLVVDLRQVLKVEVGVYLCCSNIGVPQQFLNGAKVAT
jgi:hypothetical protein